MNHRMLSPALFLSLLLSASSAFAQSGAFWGEFGSRQNAQGIAAPAVAGSVFGGGLMLNLGGNTGKRFSHLGSLGGDMRLGKSGKESGNQGWMDLFINGDYLFRVGRVTFGPGAVLTAIGQEYALDARCLARTDIYSSCWSNTGDVELRGKRDLGTLLALGGGGLVKVNFGPQDRIAAQFRYTHLIPGYAGLLDSTEMLGVINAVSPSTATPDLPVTPPRPTDWPSFESGHDLRISSSYVFKLGYRAAYFVRGELANRAVTFTMTGANNNGIFNHDNTNLTIGAGVAF